MVNSRMNTSTLFLIAISLALDAFAVSVIGGTTIHPMTRRTIFRLSFHFGLFQFMMPVLGWLVGNTIADYIKIGITGLHLGYCWLLVQE